MILLSKVMEMEITIDDPLSLNDVMFEGQLELLDGTRHPIIRNSSLNDQVIQGNGKFLLSSLQLFCNNFSAPFFRMGFPEYNKEKTNYYLNCPTTKIYHLEVLGKLYDILGMFSDSKKCYMSQYDITGEFELLDAVKILSQKISSTPANISFKNPNPRDISKDEVGCIIDETEKNLKNFINSINDLDWNQFFLINPKIFEHHNKQRQSDMDSLLSVHDEGFADTMTLWDLTTCVTFIRDTKPELIIPYNLIRNLNSIRYSRNQWKAHIRKFSERALQFDYNIIFYQCGLVNEFFKKYFNNKDLV